MTKAVTSMTLYHVAIEVLYCLCLSAPAPQAPALPTDQRVAEELEDAAWPSSGGGLADGAAAEGRRCANLATAYSASV